MAAITVASPRILSLPQVGSTGILGAGIGFNSQITTGTIASTNTDTTALLGLVDLQLSAFGSANAGGATGVGSRWTPKHLTITVTNTSGQTLTGLTLTTSNVDAPAAPGSADYAYGTASEWPSGGLASGDSVTVTYTILGTIKRYLWLTGTWTTAPTSGALAVDTNLSGEGSAKSVLSGSLAPHQVYGPTLMQTLPYTEFGASTDTQTSFILRPEAIMRTLQIVSTLDQATINALLGLRSPQGNPILGNPVNLGGIGTSNSSYTFTSGQYPMLGANASAAVMQFNTGSTAATTGNLYIYLTEVV